MENTHNEKLEKLKSEKDRLVKLEKYDFARLIQIQIEKIEKEETKSEKQS